MDIRVFPNVWSPELGNRRTIDVYLPSSYGRTRRRYPVVYMHDGQNLSDPATAFAGTWNLVRTLELLASEGLEAIVVGIHNAGDNRAAEYSPFADSRHGGGRGAAYLRFLARTLKPRIDRRFRTKTGRESTVIAGSSMGGLISLYAVFSPQSEFGAAASLSPALWFGDRRIFEWIRGARARAGRIYLDIGTAEGAAAVRDVHRMRRLLAAKGYDDRSLRFVESTGARHTEGAWAMRLPDALRFICSGDRADISDRAIS